MANFVSLIANSPDFLPYASLDLQLTTTETYLTIDKTISSVKLYSDSTVASDRPLIIGPGEIEGQVLLLSMESGDIGPTPSSLLLSTISASYMRLSASWTPVLYEKLELVWLNGTWQECYRSEAAVPVNPFDPVINNPQDADVLIYDAGDEEWKNQLLSQDVTITNTGVATTHIRSSEPIAAASGNWTSSASVRYIVGNQLAMLSGYFTCVNDTTDNYGTLPVGYHGSFSAVGSFVTGGGALHPPGTVTCSGVTL